MSNEPPCGWLRDKQRASWSRASKCTKRQLCCVLQWHANHQLLSTDPLRARTWNSCGCSLLARARPASSRTCGTWEARGQGIRQQLILGSDYLRNSVCTSGRAQATVGLRLQLVLRGIYAPVKCTTLEPGTHLCGDLGQRLGVGAAHDGRDEPALRGHRHRNVHCEGQAWLWSQVRVSESKL